MYVVASATTRTRQPDVQAGRAPPTADGRVLQAAADTPTRLRHRHRRPLLNHARVAQAAAAVGPEP